MSYPSVVHIPLLGTAKVKGPQSFASQMPGVEIVDSALMSKNKQIEQNLLNAADQYYSAHDLRWFFAFAHGQITKQINENIRLFQRPNAMIKFNIHFAEEFLRAVNGEPHAQWHRAFQFCS